MVSTMPFLLMILMGLSSSPVASPPSDPLKSRANYESVFSHLEQGGDLIVVANIDGIIENAVANLRNLTSLMPMGIGEASAAFDRLPGFITASGLYAVDGFGMSSVPLGDGLNRARFFLRRDPAAAALPLWRAMAGGAPRALASLDYLPADTVLARTGAGEPAQLYKLVTDAINQVGGPEASNSFARAVVEAGDEIGTNIEAIVASFGADAFLAVQLSTNRTLAIPLPAPAGGGDPLTIPFPSLLLGTAVRDQTLPTVIRRLLERNDMSCVTSLVDGVTLVSITLPPSEAYPINPTFAIHKGMLLFGSTPDSVKAALSAAVNKNGLRKTEAFQKNFSGLPLENNGFSMVDRRFTETLGKIQARMLQSAMRGMGAVPGAKSPFGQIIGEHMLVLVNEKDGIAIRGTTTAGAGQTLLGTAMLPVAAVGAGIAIPSFVRARQSTVQYSCINNLRMLDSAKEQWALVENKNNGAVVGEKDLKAVLEYIKGNAMPVCPQGGKYTLGPIGTLPTCSHPGHAMPAP